MQTGCQNLPKTSYVWMQNWLRAVVVASLQWTSPLLLPHPCTTSICRSANRPYNEKTKRYIGPTNRLIIPVPPVRLHLRKSLLNKRSDKPDLLLNLGGKF